jgi:hypothetical protein
MRFTEIRTAGLAGVLAALLLLSLALLSHPADAAKRKPRGKLYSISLTTTVKAASTESLEGPTPPSGCKGRNTETFRYFASAHISPAPKRMPLLKHGRFRYFVYPGQQRTGLKASLTEDVTASWEVDPTAFGAEDPSACAFQPTHTVGDCRSKPVQDGFELFPEPGNGGRFTLGYDAAANYLECPPVNYSVPDGFFGATLISLKVGSVLALRRDHSVRAAGSVSRPLTSSLSGDRIGTETLRYAVKITRRR